jgi:phosphoribosylformylglycinamidine cyclo-ligase
MSHITGGGLAANLERVLPAEVSVTLDRSSWELPPIFRLVAETGDVALPDLEKTLNCGVGMVSLTPAEDVDAAIAILAEHDIHAWVAGSVAAAEDAADRGVVRLVNDYA